jgi:hypothetical protein
MPQAKHATPSHRQIQELGNQHGKPHSFQAVPKQSFADRDEYLTNSHIFNAAKLRNWVDLGPGAQIIHVLFT